jgi:uncharacterized protein (DUF58 family)
MQYTRINRRSPGVTGAPGVYAERDDLMRLRFKAAGFSFLPRQPIHSVLAGRHASRLRGRGLNFEELRGYLRGDDPRHIDWKVTARTGKPHVRVYTEEKDRTVWLLVDQRIWWRRKRLPWAPGGCWRRATGWAHWCSTTTTFG